MTAKINFLTLLLILTAGKSFSQDYCKDVLDAAYNRLSISSNQSSVSAAKNWFCSDNFFSDIKNFTASGSISIPIDGIPIKFGASGNDYSSLQKREQVCNSSSSYFSSDQALTIFKQVVEKRTIEAWERCMIEKFRGSAGTSIYLEEEVTNNDILVKAKFRITDDALRDKIPLVMSYFITNAYDIKGDWVTGKAVPLTGILHQFRRKDENETVTITLTTTLGISQTLTIKGKEYPLEIGYIKATWEEPTQGEGEPQEVLKELVTLDHHCEGDCRDEPTRTNYSIRLEVKDNTGRLLTPSEGYLKDPKLNCMEGPCGGWNQVKEVRLLNKTTAYASWDVWTRPTRWRLSGNWVYYTESWKYGSTSQKTLNRGDRITLNIPTNAKNVKIYGKTLEGYFEFSMSNIKSDKWLKYESYTTNWGNYNLQFRVAQRPE
jgi:hypothetical protein